MMMRPFIVRNQAQTSSRTGDILEETMLRDHSDKKSDSSSCCCCK